jgi:hypothetical protein
MLNYKWCVPTNDWSDKFNFQSTVGSHVAWIYTSNNILLACSLCFRKMTPLWHFSNIKSLALCYWDFLPIQKLNLHIIPAPSSCDHVNLFIHCISEIWVLCNISGQLFTRYIPALGLVKDSVYFTNHGLGIAGRYVFWLCRSTEVYPKFMCRWAEWCS